MAKVSSSSSIYTDPQFDDWGALDIFFYEYLFMNDHVHGVTGIGQIRPAVMQIETRMTAEQIAKASSVIGDRVVWFAPGVYWVVARSKHAAYKDGYINDRYYASVRKELDNLGPEIASAFCERYPEFNQKDHARYDVKLTSEMAVAIREDFKCAYCGKDLTPDTLVRDVIDVHGHANYTNMVAAHQKCADNKTPATIKHAQLQARSYHEATAKRIVATDSSVAAQVERFNGFVRDDEQTSPPAIEPLHAVPDKALGELDELSTKILGGSHPAQIMEAVKMHGAEHVKAALLLTEGKAKSWAYTNKILQRWAKEGYPKPEPPKKMSILDVEMR